MNRRALTVLSIAAATPLVLTACSTPLNVSAGSPTTEVREITDVTAVSLAAVGDVRLTVGEEPALTVTAGDRVMDRITTDVRDGVLVLDIDGPTWGNPGRITYDLVLPAVEKLSVDGAGDIDADLSAARSVELHLNGAGQIIGRDLAVDDLYVEVDGAGDVEVSGTAERQVVGIDGVGSYDGRRLHAQSAEVTIGGAGDARVDVARMLQARVDGAGEILHHGDAEVVSQVSGIGDVRQW